MCGESMHLRQREQVTAIPGTPETARRTVAEWECPGV